MAPAEDYISWNANTPVKIRTHIPIEAGKYAPMCIQTMMRETVKEFPDNKVMVEMTMKMIGGEVEVFGLEGV